MKIARNIFILIFLTIYCVSCIKEDNTGLLGNEERYHPIGIKFVYEDGTEVLDSDCISPNIKYAVQIEVTTNNNRNTKASKIEYTINGSPYSMSFIEEGVKSNPVTLVNGKNIAELVKTAVSTEYTFVEQGEFQLIE